MSASLTDVELRCDVNSVVVGMATEATTVEKGPRGIVELLRGSAPYIELHQKSTMVVHCSSELSDDEFQDLMDDVATLHLLGVRIVLVVSVRARVDARCGRPSRLVRGLPVTGAEEMLAVQVEAGVARARVEACLARGLAEAGSSYGRSSVGVDVVSGNGFYTARPAGVVDGVDMMSTGFVRRVETDKIRRHLDNGEIVLLTSTGYSAGGGTFHVKSEEVAAFAAPALQASKLVFVTPRDLVFEQSNRRVTSLRLDDAKRLVEVLNNQSEQHAAATCALAVKALVDGVTRAHLIPPSRGALLRELYTRDGAGTLIASDIYEGIRPATKKDFSRVVELIEPLELDGTLVTRHRNDLEQDLQDGCYYVITRDDRPIACVMLKRIAEEDDEHSAAEVGCLVVDAKYRRQSKADAMLSFVERIAIGNDITHLFALSTSTMHWFLERGFQEVDFESLPQQRRNVYDQNRRPKIYRKKLETDRHIDLEDLFWTNKRAEALATNGTPSYYPASPLDDAAAAAPDPAVVAAKDPSSPLNSS